MFHEGQFAAAIPELKAALQREPRMKEAYVLLGRAYSKGGRPKEAAAALQKFEELNRAGSQDAEAKPNGAAPPN